MKVNGVQVTNSNIIWIGASFSNEFETHVEWLRKSKPRIFSNEAKWCTGTFKFTIKKEFASSKVAIDVAVAEFVSNFIDCTIETQSSDYKTYPYKFIGVLQEHSTEYIGEDAAVVSIQVKGYKQSDNLLIAGEQIQNHIKRFHFPEGLAGAIPAGLIATLTYKVTDPTKSITLAAEFNHWNAQGNIGLSEMVTWTFPANTLPIGLVNVILNSITGETTWKNVNTGDVYNAITYLNGNTLPKTHPANGTYNVSIWGSSQTNGEFTGATLEIERRWL